MAFKHLAGSIKRQAEVTVLMRGKIMFACQETELLHLLQTAMCCTQRILSHLACINRHPVRISKLVLLNIKTENFTAQILFMSVSYKFHSSLSQWLDPGVFC